MSTILASRPTAQQARVTISNELGFAARPATLLVKLAQAFDADIRISLNGRTADAKSILSLLTLGAEHGATVTVSAAGPDATDAIRAVRDFFSYKLHDLPVAALL